MGKKLTTEEFLERARKIHGDKYDYSKTIYKSWEESIIIICTEHGEFYQNAGSHLQGCGCPKCSVNRRSKQFTSSIEQFTEKAKQIHGNKYDYSKVNYINSHTKVCIICLEHGEFWQTPTNHLKGQGCPECGKIQVQKENKKRIKEAKKDFIEKAKQVHCNRYDYSKVEYVNAHKKVLIKCKEHGLFEQTPNSHLNGSGCPYCCGNIPLTIKTFIKRSNEIHHNKYDYTKVNYINSQTKVCIICPEHGEFWQVPHNHLQGQGCPKCNMSHLERDVMKIIEKYGLKYTWQASKKDLSWLGKQSLDFFLPDYNIAIECQGIQHFESVDRFGGEKELKEIIKRDKIKKELCEKHNIKLHYINYNEDFYKKILTIFNENNLVILK